MFTRTPITLFWLVAIGVLMLGACAHGGAVPRDGETAQPSATSGAKPIAPGATPFITLESRQSFDATVAAARAAIDRRGFKTFAVIDHAKGAASIDAKLNPTTLIIFGNPKGGTPLMQESQTAGLDLPLKMLVIGGADGRVDLVWTPMETIAVRHAITDQPGRLEKVSGALMAIAAEAAGAPR
ncbi:MAG: DUF302 domain-containing protein [Pseudomonadota bacterium]